jgi:hypothetical protein
VAPPGIGRPQLIQVIRLWPRAGVGARVKQKPPLVSARQERVRQKASKKRRLGRGLPAARLDGGSTTCDTARLKVP